MKTYAKAILLVACNTVALCAHAYSGNEFYNNTTSDDQPYRVRAMAYLNGVVDTLQLMGAVCSPNNATIGQARDIVVKYLAQNPEHRHDEAAIIITGVLMGAWPCEKKPVTNKGRRVVL